jgi:uncharacterized iron-regulated protein
MTVMLDTITDTRTGEFLSPPELAARLDGVDLLFVGESHTDVESHQVELRVLEALHRAGREVLIGLEMFPYTQQEFLDRWSAGSLEEQAFLEQAEWYRYWGYNWGYYRDIFQFARENRLRMFGVNVPRSVVSAVRTEGFESLGEADRPHMPPRIDTESGEQRQLFRAFFDEDDELHGSLSEEAWAGMLRAQCTWDAAMGWNALQALRQHGGEKAIMVVLIGSGHVAYGLGAERQARLHFDGRIASLIPVEVDEDQPPSVQASYANFVWGVPELEFERYPSLGVSLAGSIGSEPRKVIQVTPQSPGDEAGLAVGDILLALGGAQIRSAADLHAAVSTYHWADVAPLKLERGGEELTLSVAFRRVANEDEDADEAAPAKNANPTRQDPPQAEQAEPPTPQPR